MVEAVSNPTRIPRCSARRAARAPRSVSSSSTLASGEKLIVHTSRLGFGSLWLSSLRPAVGAILSYILIYEGFVTPNPTQFGM